jgi:CDP-paratose 2-epimerase
MSRLLITGGAGFIGVNAASHFANSGWVVTVVDNLSRAGSERNMRWLLAHHRPSVEFVEADVRDRSAIAGVVVNQDAVLHLAGQVAVTRSLDDPRADFDVNAGGTLNLLEAARSRAPEAAFLYASTNKVYGSLQGMTQPVSERQPLDFHSPYGCSKGAADQYVRDYARCFNLRTVVLRQSCIYGTHQYGTEEQGWVAHFVHAIAAGAPITIFGDGRQVRDLLDVRDLCRLFSLAIDRIDACRGEVLNAGGGPDNARSLLDVIDAIKRLSGHPVSLSFSDWRPGDQRYYVSDLARVQARLGWTPEVSFDIGLRDLWAWARSLSSEINAAAA